MPVKTFLFKFPGIEGVVCAFQRRSRFSDSSALDGNISYKVGDNPEKVLARREKLMAQLPGLERWSECEQIHGIEILDEPDPTELRPASLPRADGMMTTKKGLGLMIKTADCQPLFIAHKSGEFIMALHVGWRGNRQNFPGRAVKIFCRAYDVAPADLLAVRGPSLGPQAARFVNFNEEWGSEWRRWLDPTNCCMNLWALTAFQLEQAGLPGQNIYALDICTWENSNDFFSYRKNKNTGRQANFIWRVGLK